MTDTQFWILVLIGVVQCVLLWALLVKREMPPISTPPDGPSTVQPHSADLHSHHIYGCELVNGEWRDVEELRNGMMDPANHERMKWWLSQGEEKGIRWQHGRVEPGTHAPAPLLYSEDDSAEV